TARSVRTASKASIIRANGSEGLAARAVVAVELAAGVDGDADRRLAAHRLDVMPAVLRPEHEVTGLGVDGRGLVLDVPVDLALEPYPPFIVQLVVRVVRVSGRVADDERLDVVGEHDRVGPWRLAMLRLEIVDTREQFAD